MINMNNYEQQSIFGFPEYKITKKIRLIEMFGGIGSQAGNAIVKQVLMAIFKQML